jgi:hypothetical protein
MRPDPVLELLDWLEGLDDETIVERAKATRAAMDHPIHLIKVTEVDYVLQHPLACRPNLFECAVQLGTQLWNAAPVPAGIYEATLDGDDIIALSPVS